MRGQRARKPEETLQIGLIVVDDCSTDASLTIARGLAERVPGMILLHHEKNQGKGAALRTGIASATTLPRPS